MSNLRFSFQFSPPMNYKNLNSEIETKGGGNRSAMVVSMNYKNLNSEIET